MASTMDGMADCTGLTAFQDFGDYMSLVRNRTSFNETLLGQCRVPVCGAVWGYGVPDISGIGVAIAYTVTNFIGPFLAFLLLLSPRLSLSAERKHALQATLTAGITSFFECAAYFALAIQIASTVMLVLKDYELQPVLFGDYEARAAALACTACMLPLLYPIAVLSGDHAPTLPAVQRTQPRQPQRLGIFALAVLASLYPFLSQSVRAWSPSQVGTGAARAGDVHATAEEWAALARVCFGPLDYLTARESTALAALHLLGSLAVVAAAAGVLVPPVVRRLRRDDEDDASGGAVGARPADDDATPARKAAGGACAAALRACRRRPVGLVLLALPVCLAAPLLWGFWRLRALQMQLARATGGHYEGNEWGFGQVMAVAMFVPVGVEIMYAALRAPIANQGIIV